jgi:hypothetical protein
LALLAISETVSSGRLEDWERQKGRRRCVMLRYRKRDIENGRRRVCVLKKEVSK